jgi:hypothetical protein
MTATTMMMMMMMMMKRSLFVLLLVCYDSNLSLLVSWSVGLLAGRLLADFLHKGNNRCNRYCKPAVDSEQHVWLRPLNTILYFVSIILFYDKKEKKQRSGNIAQYSA